MVKDFSFSLCLLSLLLFCFACQKKEENRLLSNEINFCSLLDNPKQYESKLVQTKAIVLGYHTFIFYSNQCLDEEHIAALEMNFESRQKLTEAIKENKKNYKSSFLNSNLYAEITVLGEIKTNGDKTEPEVFYPKYKMFVNGIKNVKILSEEIFPATKD